MRNWSLDALIRPHTAEAFFAAHHEKHRLLVHRDDPRYFAELLTLDDVDRILTTLEARYAEINLVDADREIALADYVNADDTINIDRLFQLHASGATVILNHLHRRHPPLADLCGALELEFSAPVQTNIYLTPPQDKGFKAHFDTHDVFVLQLTGTKAWRLYDTPIALPLRGHGNEAAREDFGTPSETFELRPGDTLYIPRGLVHDADATDEPSLHITVGILAWTWFDFLLDAVAELAATEEKARAALPPGFADPHFDRSAARETFGNFVDLLATRVDIDRLFDLSIETFIDRRRLPLRGGLAALHALPRLSAESLVGRQPGLVYRLDVDAETLRLRCAGKEVSLPAHAAAAVRYALETDRFRVADLPGTLDDAGKLVLARRLVREGLLRIISIDGPEA